VINENYLENFVTNQFKMTAVKCLYKWLCAVAVLSRGYMYN